MSQHSSEWIHERPQLEQVSIAVREGARVVLYGETGSGKTTIINSFRHYHSNQSADEHVLIFDFNNVAVTLNAAPGDKAKLALQQQLLTWIEKSIETSVETFLEFGAERDRLAEEDAAEFAVFRSDYERSFRVPFRTEDEPKRSAHVRDSHDLQDSLREARAAFSRSTPATGLAFLVRAIANLRTLTLCFDNIDPLDSQVREQIGIVAQELAIATNARIGVVVACRSEHRSAMQTALDAGTVDPVPVDSLTQQPVDDPESWAIGAILIKRLGLLTRRSGLMAHLELDLSEDETIQFRSALHQIMTQYGIILSELCIQAEPDRENQRLSHAVVRWANEDIRTTITIINSLVDRESDLGGLLSQNLDVIKSRLVHTFYKHLFTGEPGDHGTTVRKCLEFFVPNNTSAVGRPFYFLRFRMLAHINHMKTEGNLSAKSVFEAFQADFGVSAADTRRALNWLANRDGMNSGYIRLETHEGRTIRLQGSPGEEDRVMIVLLPSGIYFCDQLVSRVEYLFWLAIEHRQFQGVTSGVDVRSRGASRLDRAAGAVDFLDNYLLPMFLREHPYMDHEVEVDPSDPPRLARFRKAFGYTEGRWFIERIAQSIQRYAEAFVSQWPGIYTENKYRQCLDRVDQYVRRLNEVEKLCR